jgi:hypothetical protein
MAFLQPDVLVECLMTEIDRVANTPCPMAQREQQIAKLEEEIDIGCSALRRPLAGLPAMGRARCESCRGAWRSRRDEVKKRFIEEPAILPLLGNDRAEVERVFLIIKAQKEY